MSETTGTTVVHLSTARSWRGGEQQALLLARGLRERGVSTRMVTQPDSPMAQRARDAGIDVDEIRCRGEFDLLAALRLRSLLRRCNASVVHAHDAHAVPVAGLAACGTGARRVCTRRVDFTIRSAWKYNRLMDRTICISQAIRDICASGGVNPQKISIVYSGIDFARIDRTRKNADEVKAEFVTESEKKRPLLLLNVASLTDHKGQRYLLEAMPAVLARIPQVYLVIVGTGELEDELRRLANTLALDEHCIFAGFRDDVPDLLAACDLFVMSSHLEGLCTSVMDAMAAGKAVVACRAGGLAELVEDGRTGHLVPPRDPEALTQALVDLLGDRKKRERFGRQALERARRTFGYEQMVDGTLGVYRELGIKP